MRRTAVLSAALALALAGCSSGSKGASAPQHASAPVSVTSTSAAAATTTTTASQSSIAARYVAALARVNAVSRALQAKLTAVPSAATAAQVAPIFAPYAAALRDFDNTILRLGATGRTATDIRSLVAADAKLEGVLGTISDQTARSINTWVSDFKAAESASASAAGVVRADLGLPPAPSS